MTRKRKLIVGGILVIVLPLLGLLGYLLFQGIGDAQKVQQRVTSFLSEVSSGNYENAYVQTSQIFKKSTTEEEFANSASALSPQYSDFQSQKQTGFSVEANLGQPTLYNYSGLINYTDGSKGVLEAVLTKEDGEWRLVSVDVTVGSSRTD